MIITLSATGIGGFVHRRQDMNGPAWIGLETIPFVRADPSPWKHAGRGIHRIDYFNRCRRRAWGMVGKIRAHQAPVPTPAILRIRRGMDAHPTTAGSDEVLQRR